jgi:hypothetical protein
MALFVEPEQWYTFQERVVDLLIVFFSYLKALWVFLFDKNKHYLLSSKLYYVRNGEDDEEDVTREYRIGGAQGVLKDLSPDITDILFEVLYAYNSKRYKYLTHDPNHVFPPKKPGVSFRLPIKEAFLLDAEGAPETNVTEEIKMYQGPDVDFHGETILVRDMDLPESGPTLRLVSITGNVVEYSREDSFSHQTIWLPNKT